MRAWTAAAFDAALDSDSCRGHRGENRDRDGYGGDDVVWLRSRADPLLAESAARANFRRGCETFARTTTLVGLGSVISAALPGSATAPVSQAHAAIEAPSIAGSARPFEIDAAALPEPLPLDAIAPRPLATTTLQDQRREIEEFLRFGSRDVPRRLVETVIRAANTTQVDPVYLMALADTESSFRTDVKAPTSSAEGLFQFVDRTWLEMIRLHGATHGAAEAANAIAIVEGKPVVADEARRADILALRRDPYLAAVLAAEMLKTDAAMIGFRIGRRLNQTEMYLAHFLGLEQAGQFLAMREARQATAAARIFRAAARANTALFYARGKRGRLRALTIDQVYGKIDRIIGTRTERYRDVTAVAGAGLG